MSTETGPNERQRKEMAFVGMVRAVVARLQGVTPEDVSNWRPLGEQFDPIVAELERMTGKSRPTNPPLDAKSTFIQLLSAFHD